MNFEQQHMQQLEQLLNGILSSDERVRKSAEASFATCERQPKFGCLLAQVVLSNQIQLPFRHLSAVLLKQHVKKYWEKGIVEEFPDFEIAEEDKNLLKTVLPQGLADPSSKISTAVSMVIANIAEFDFPAKWPNLLQDLMSSLNNSPPQSPLIYGCIRCLSLVAEHFDETHVPQVVPVLLPNMLHILTNPQYTEKVRVRSLTVVRSLLISLANVYSVKKKVVASILTAEVLQTWLKVLTDIIAMPSFDGEKEKNCSLKLEALQVLTVLVRDFPKLISPFMPVIMQHLWKSLTTEYPFYEKFVINTEDSDESKEYDTEGEDISFPAFIAQELEIVFTIVSAPAYSELILPNLETLTLYVIGYLQITNDQILEWDDSPNKYVADEDDDSLQFSVRISARDMIMELSQVYEELAINAVCTSASKQLMAAAQKHAAQDPNWWKLREAALLALGTLDSDNVCFDGFMTEEEKKICHLATNTVFNTAELLQNVLTNDLKPETHVYLRSRGIWFCSKYCKPGFCTDDVKLSLFSYLVNTMSSKEPLQVRIMACKALARLMEEVRAHMTPDILSKVLPSIVSLLTEASEDTLHIVLESLTLIIKHNVQLFEQVGQQNGVENLIPTLLNTWLKYSNDILITTDVLDTFENMSKCPSFLGQIQQHVLPALLNIIKNPASVQGSVDADENEFSITATAIDMVAIIFKHSRNNIEQMVQVAVPLIANIIINGQDPDVFQNGSECLRAIVFSGWSYLQNWNEGIQLILQAISKLLEPSLDDSASAYVGNLITIVFQKLGGQISTVIHQVLVAAINKLFLAEQSSISLIQSLILVFLHLMHSNLNTVLDFLYLIPIPDEVNKAEDKHPGKAGQKLKAQNGLEFFMRKWLEHHPALFSAYDGKVSITALHKVLLARDPRITNMMAVHHVIIQAKTRAQAKDAKKDFLVSVPAKMLYELCKSYLHELDARMPASFRKSKDNKLESDDENEGDENDNEEWEDEEDEDLYADADLLEEYADGETGLDLVDEDETEAVYLQDDPIYKIDSMEFLRTAILGIYQNDQVTLRECAMLLDKSEKDQLEKAIFPTP